MERITSRQNAVIRHLRRLASERRYRRESGQFLCEGPKMLTEAERWGFVPHTMVDDRPEVLALWEGRCAKTALVAPDLLRYAAGTETPQGPLFTCPLPDRPEGLPGARLLVLDGVQDPGNVGTIWRTADAFGADGLVLLPGCADPWSPKTVRACMGACFRLEVREYALEELASLLARRGVPLYATALEEAARDVRNVDLSGCAVVIGSEGRGVSRPVLERCAGTVKIPMRERCESLNAAMAAGIVLWENWSRR